MEFKDTQRLTAVAKKLASIVGRDNAAFFTELGDAADEPERFTRLLATQSSRHLERHPDEALLPAADFRLLVDYGEDARHFLFFATMEAYAESQLVRSGEGKGR